jgi:hypothetical protein
MKQTPKLKVISNCRKVSSKRQEKNLINYLRRKSEKISNSGLILSTTSGIEYLYTLQLFEQRHDETIQLSLFATNSDCVGFLID